MQHLLEWRRRNSLQGNDFGLLDASMLNLAAQTQSIGHTHSTFPTFLIIPTIRPTRTTYIPATHLSYASPSATVTTPPLQSSPSLPLLWILHPAWYGIVDYLHHGGVVSDAMATPAHPGVCVVILTTHYTPAQLAPPVPAPWYNPPIRSHPYPPRVLV